LRRPWEGGGETPAFPSPVLRKEDKIPFRGRKKKEGGGGEVTNVRKKKFGNCRTRR